jgi:hypothetical protein
VKLTKNQLKRIRHYSKQRAGDEPALNVKTLAQIYENASKELRAVYDKEMLQYDKAIKEKKVEKGQSILHWFKHL